MITDDEKDSEDRIWCGKDKYGNEIWKTEEELEQEAVKLQKWQRDKFARELGLNIPSMAFIYCKKCGEY